MGKCFEGLAKVLKSLSIKKCHSSCCQIDMEGGNSTPTSPTSKRNSDNEIYMKNPTSDKK